MTLANVLAKVRFTGFSAADRATINDVITTSYNGSAIAKTMYEDWIATGKTIQVKEVGGAFQAYASTGKIEIDLNFLTNANYINNNGKAVIDTPTTAIVHELVHALTGKVDNYDDVDYRGDTVKFSNTIYAQLGLDEQNSYISYDNTGTILTRNYDYTGGSAIDRSFSGNINWSSDAAGNSKDLLIGGGDGNTLQSGNGDDFLFGAGGADSLLGGAGTDTAVYTGKPTDYDVRLNADGTWSVKHLRGSTLEGSDTLTNIEKISFRGTGDSYDLSKGGLRYQTDFAFVVDQTGSMGDDIDAVKASATSIINALFGAGTIDARIGVVGFRDSTIGEPTEVLQTFTDDVSFGDRKTAALAAINALSASGGGDFPETAFEGLLKALDGSMGEWRTGAGVKRVVLFTDADAKDTSLAPTVQSYATNIGATVSGRHTDTLGSFGAVDTFKLTSNDGRNVDSDGGTLPPTTIVPETPSLPGGSGIVQVFTIFIDTFTTPGAEITALSEATGGEVLPALDPSAVVDKLIEIITGYHLVDGTDVGETLTGTAAADKILGRDGDDRIKGLAGDDLINGGKGNDTILGGGGKDIILGGGGKDIMKGGDAADQMTGGAGNDRMTGDAGSDNFIFAKGFGDDTVTDLNLRSDTITFDDRVFADFDAMLDKAVVKAGGVLISAAGGHTLFLQDVTFAQINAHDDHFLFV